MDGVTAGGLLTLKRLSGTGFHSAAPGCEYFRAFEPCWAGQGHILLRPWEVESNIHHTQLGKKKTLKIQQAATKSLKTQRGGKLMAKIAREFLPVSMHFCLCV